MDAAGVEAGDALLERMVEALRHRGPDDSGIHWSGPGGRAALCASRLAIQDLSQAGHQPMTSGTGRTLAFNGEIYNVAELRDALEDRGRSFRGHSDTEVVLAAFDEWGERALERLEGIYALAVWDDVERRLTLARDRLGVKPLYFHERDGRLSFASEVRALRAAGLVDRQVDPLGVAGFLAAGAVPEPYSILAGVKPLPPGHTLTWSSGRWSLRRYWSLEEAFSHAVEMDRETAVEGLRHHLQAAVARQLISDAPLGVFLSGGLDSSSLVAMTAHATAEPLRTISLVFEAEEYSELPYIRAVAERYATRHTQVELSPDEFLRDLPAALAALDQPTVDGMNTFVVSRLAREAGLKVVLSGIGGDELFAGYELFSTIPRLEMARRVARGPLVPLATRVASRRFGDDDRGRKLRRWLAGESPNAYVLHREILEPAVRRRLAPGLPVLDGCEDTKAARDINDISRMELGCYALNMLLRDADVLSMANSVEVRVPLLDERLVEFVGSVPGRHKLARGRQKPLLVDAMDGLLPPEIVNRPKSGFVLPFEHWMRGRLRSQVEEALLDPGFGGQIARLLDPVGVARLWEDFTSRRTGWTRPWTLYTLKVWGERHLAS